MQINLEITKLDLKFYNVKIKMYKLKLDKEDSLYAVRAEFNYKQKRRNIKKDTVYYISKKQFNYVCSLSSNLSCEKIIKGMNPSELSLNHAGGIFLLKITVSHIESILFDISNPGYDTKKRNLKEFYDLCKEIILLAKLNPKEYFLEE